MRRLQGSFIVEHSLERRGAKSFGNYCTPKICSDPGALTGNQAVQQVKAGLKAIYLRAGRLRRRNPRTKCIPTSLIRRTGPGGVKRINQAPNVPIKSIMRGKDDIDGSLHPRMRKLASVVR